MPDLTGQDGTRNLRGQQYKNRVYLCDGRTLPKKYDGVAWYNMGIRKANYPDNIRLTSAVAGGATGTVGAGNLNGLYVWVLQPVNITHTIPTGRKVAGIPSLLSAQLTLNAQGADITGIPATHPDSQVTGWDLFRNQAAAWQTGDDAGQDYKFVAYIPIGTTTYTDNNDDSALVGVDSLRFNQNFPPCFNTIALYGDRLFGAGFDAISSGTATIATKTITTKSLTSNVATITTSAVHGYVVGQLVTVNSTSHDAVFDGCHYITAVGSTTTFSFLKINADVAGVAETGTTEVINFSVALPTGALGCWFQASGDANRYRIVGNYSTTQITLDRGFSGALAAASYTVYRDAYQIYFSEQFDVEAWGPDSEGLRYYLEVPGKKEVRALLTYFGSILVFTNNEIFVISGQGPDRTAVTISPQAVYNDCGTFSQRSVKTVEEQIYFLTRRGLMVMNTGGQPELCSYKILRDWLVSLSDADLAIATVGCQGRYVNVSVVATTGDSENSVSFRYDRYLEQWDQPTSFHPGDYFEDDGDNGFPDTFYYQGSSIFQAEQGTTDVTTVVYSGSVTSNTTLSATDTTAAFPTTSGGVVEGYIEFFDANLVSQGRRRIVSNTATAVTWSSTAVGGGVLTITNGWTYKIGHIHWKWKTRTLEDPGHQARVLFGYVLFDAWVAPDGVGTVSHITITEYVDGIARATKNYIPVYEQTLKYDFNTRGHTYALQVESWDGATVREIAIVVEQQEYA